MSVKKRKVTEVLLFSFILTVPIIRTYLSIKGFKTILISEFVIFFIHIHWLIFSFKRMKKTLISIENERVSEKTGLQLILSFRCRRKKKKQMNLHRQDRTDREKIIYHVPDIIVDMYFI